MHFEIRMAAISVPTDGGDVRLLRDFQLDDTHQRAFDWERGKFRALLTIMAFCLVGRHLR
jgi:hypothetical protein